MDGNTTYYIAIGFSFITRVNIIFEIDSSNTEGFFASFARTILIVFSCLCS